MPSQPSLQACANRMSLAVVMGEGRKLNTGPLHLLSIVSSFEQPRRARSRHNDLFLGT